MKPLAYGSLCLLFALSVSACTALKPASKTEANTQAKTEVSPQASPQTQSTPTAASQGELQVGQASGSYTAKGETVELKYAYAGRGIRFGKESLVILITDKPIPADAVAKEIASPTLLENEQLKGLEYVIDTDGMWVRFHPSQYQESSSNKIKDYSVEGDVVRGVDEGSGLNDKYGRSVKFVAAIVK
jgi:hypothetical protein